MAGLCTVHLPERRVGTFGRESEQRSSRVGSEGASVSRG